MWWGVARVGDVGVTMESEELVAFDDRLLRPSGDALTTLVDSIADIDARRPAPGRFASQADAARFDRMRGRLLRLISDDRATEERRLHARIPCDLWVEVSHHGRERPGVIEDLGSGGVFVSTLLEAEVGDEVSVVIEADEELMDVPLNLRARVAWRGSPRRTGFGAAFMDDGDSSHQAMDRLVGLLLKSSYSMAWRPKS